MIMFERLFPESLTITTYHHPFLFAPALAVRRFRKVQNPQPLASVLGVAVLLQGSLSSCPQRLRGWKRGKVTEERSSGWDDYSILFPTYD